MGMVGITEGAIPFTASNPLRVIPSNMISSAIASTIVMTFGAGNPAPWGGWIIAFVATNPLIYIMASLIGIAVTTTMVVLLKPTPKQEAVKPAATSTVKDDDFELDDLKMI